MSKKLRKSRKETGAWHLMSPSGLDESEINASLPGSNESLSIHESLHPKSADLPAFSPNRVHSIRWVT